MTLDVGLVTDMWPSVSEPFAGGFIAASVARGPADVRHIVLVPKLYLPTAHRRIWGTNSQ